MRRDCVKWRHVHTALNFEFSSNSKDWKSPTSNSSQQNTEQDVYRHGCLCAPAHFEPLVQPSRNKRRELSHPASLEKVILQTAFAESLPKSAQKSWTSNNERTKGILTTRGASWLQTGSLSPSHDSRWGNTGCHGLWGSSLGHELPLEVTVPLQLIIKDSDIQHF